MKLSYKIALTLCVFAISYLLYHNNFRHIEKKSEKPNIIFLLCDDLRADAVGYIGNETIKTPNIDRLAKEGTVFNNAYVTTSICAVSRASILLGQYARKHKIWGFSKNLSENQLNNSYPFILKNAGYNIGFIGKYGVGTTPPKELFNFWEGFNGQGTFKQKDIEGKQIHLSAKIGNQAVQFLNQNTTNKSPFCLSVSFKAPHVEGDPGYFLPDSRYNNLYEKDSITVPQTSHKEFHNHFPKIFTENNVARNRWGDRFSNKINQKENIKKYYRLISGIDNEVGKIIETLKKNGQDKNTVIIFSSDNGFYLGEYGFAGKWFGSEPSIKVPLIINDLRNQKKKLPKKSIEEIVLNIDIAPTILEYAGTNIPKDMQGKSLVALLEGKKQNWRNYFFYEHLWKSSKRYYIPSTEGIVYKDKKYMRYFKNFDADSFIFEELYTLENDPYETKNLVNDSTYSDLKEVMKHQLKKAKQNAYN